MNDMITILLEDPDVGAAWRIKSIKCQVTTTIGLLPPGLRVHDPGTVAESIRKFRIMPGG